jgi:hypothetical protein
MNSCELETNDNDYDILSYTLRSAIVEVVFSSIFFGFQVSHFSGMKQVESNQEAGNILLATSWLADPTWVNTHFLGKPRTKPSISIGQMQVLG